jgi:hypothetical protein
VVIVTDTPTPQPTDVNQPQTTVDDTTVAAPTNNVKTTAAAPKQTSQVVQQPSGQSTHIIGTTITSDLGSAPSAASSSFPTSTSVSHTGGGSSGGFSGVSGKTVATGVGITVGVVGGFAAIVLGIYFWRRHSNRRNMERLGSMEELRPPSPPLLSRSLTRGYQPRQPIDDDDDFLTPMDTLPNSHKMSPFDQSQSNDTAAFYSEEHVEYEGEGEGDYDQNAQYEQDAQHYEQDPHGHYPQDSQGHYAQDGQGHYPQDQGHYQQEYEQPALPENFPVAPPAAVVANNSRYYENEYENDMSQMASPASASSSAAIPSYSAMNKYAAFSPGAAAPAASSPAPAPVPEATTGYDGVAVGYDPYATGGPLNSRPGGGYRAYDSADAGGYV